MRNISTCFLALITGIVLAQDKGVFIEYENKYWKETIAKEIANYDAPSQKKSKRFKMDLEGKNFPTDRKLYKEVWHQSPISQGSTGTCWSFSTTSYFESEIYRIHGKKVKLSELYTVYWETVEKARRFVQERGNSLFDEGSEGNAVVRMWQKYGAVPMEFYPGKKQCRKFHAHDTMFEEMKNYLTSVKKNNAWNEKQVVETIRAILDHHIGAPPSHIVIDCKKITPREYLSGLVKLDDYLDLISLTQSPYYKLVEYNVPDNWWHSQEYWNVPLDDFMYALRNATQNGFSVCLGGDIGEPGYNFIKKVAIIPDFDIPGQYINEHSRQFRFSNKTTTDDHGIHCVGWLEKDGVYWYVIKDSGSGARNGKNPGYMFYREDYIKLKMMNIMVHKDAVPKIWKKYQQRK